MDLNRSPETIAYAADAEVRALNHRTNDSGAFTYPGEVQATACGLNALLLKLPQALNQLASGLVSVQDRQDLHTYDNSDADEIVDMSNEDFLSAAAHVRKAQAVLQLAVNRLAYLGAQVPEDEADDEATVAG
ncbi:hypothetical protein ACF06X_33810 [Streptomyces sp. NPDC015346]|uniref:hypothetical protein n=1 Tax=Streptomyces sp. NPDC015346 TaxID=3364954 RepID=UPI0036FECD3D